MLYNLGDCPCPTHDAPNRGFPVGWTAEDVWYISWHRRNLPFPQNYLASGEMAQEWQYLAEWAWDKKTSDMEFKGVLTQFSACAERKTCTVGVDDNLPSTGWQQLWLELNSYDATLQPALQWLSDVSWSQR